MRIQKVDAGGLLPALAGREPAGIMGGGGINVVRQYRTMQKPWMEGGSPSSYPAYSRRTYRFTAGTRDFAEATLGYSTAARPQSDVGTKLKHYQRPTGPTSPRNHGRTSTTKDGAGKGYRPLFVCRMPLKRMVAIGPDD